jgi:HSP20 family protein
MENNYNNENNNGILPIDLFNRFFGLGRRTSRGLFDKNDMFRGFDDMHREMNRMFDVFNDLSTNAPKELVREYETSEGGKVREGKNMGQYIGANKPQITAEREPLADITTTDKEVKVVLEIPGIKKEDIKINAYDEKVEIKTADNSERKYHKVLDLPKQADLETARSNYNNGILEVTFDKKKETKPKGKEIKIE